VSLTSRSPRFASEATDPTDSPDLSVNQNTEENTAESLEDDPFLSLPQSISSMMNEAAVSVLEARRAKLPLTLVDVPLPVTGGTEIDDWPGGIRQKYNTLIPMITEMMTYLKFPKEAIKKREYLGEFGDEDAVGYWQNDEIQLCCFPTQDSIPYLEKMTKWGDNSTTLAIIIPQFFLDPLSNDEVREFVGSIETIYSINTMQMKGPGAMSIRGLLYRKYPGDFKLARRLEDGKYIILKTLSSKPSQSEMEEVFYNDSIERDKNLSFFDRIKTQIPSFG